MKPLTLHAHNTGPNPYKVAIVLEALKLPYEVKIWEFGDGENGVKGPVFTKINENGRVPALEDPNTSTTSWESGAVIAHLLRTYDTSHTLSPPPSSPPQLLIDFDKWTAFLLSTLGPMLGQVNWYRHYNPTKNDDALHRYEAQTYRCFDVLEGQLKKSEGASVLESGFGAVDCHFWPWVKQYAFAGLSLDKYPLIQKWLRAVGEREEVKAAYKRVEKVAKA